MTERVGEAALPVNAPCCLVVADVVGTAFRARGNGAFDEAVGVIDEELNPRRPGSGVGGSVQPLFAGSPRKNGAPSTVSPTMGHQITAVGHLADFSAVSRPILIISRFTRAESVEHLVHLGPSLPRTRRVSRHNRQEAVAGQRLQLKIGRRSNRGRTPHPAQQAISPNPSPGPRVVTR